MCGIPLPLKKTLNLSDQEPAKLYTSNLLDIASNTRVSCTIKTTSPEVQYGLTTVAKHPSDTPTTAKSAQKGWTKAPAMTANHRKAEATWMGLASWKTAMTRIKNRKELRGSANVENQMVALPTAMQLTAGAAVVHKIVQGPSILSLDNTIKPPANSIVARARKPKVVNLFHWLSFIAFIFVRRVAYRERI